MDAVEHNLLTLDFWQDQVTYEGHTFPTGTLGCSALNTPEEILAEMNQPAAVLITVYNEVALGQVSTETLLPAREAVMQMLALLRNLPPFEGLDYDFYNGFAGKLFSDTAMQNAVDYVEAASRGEATAADEQYRSGVGLLRLLQLFAQLPATMAIYRQSILPFAEALHESNRTADDYAAAFGAYFSSSLAFSASDPSWASLSNVSVQYVSAVMPEKEQPQLVKRMHYVSFVGMLRSDLFEGLCVGHAPRKCPICGRWFLTIDARHTKYCGGLAPGDERGRTCRQIGAKLGRAKRERADDHPIKAVYNRRMNTILQSTKRKKLDEDTAQVMKRLAKSKMERAISDVDYANGSYKQEMEQSALLAEAQEQMK
ncbi:MAG: DUF6076 domain-containing protein [Clostridiales bacterium]|nr:DUF6076 domain-containing protein [Clostridiales bacterium]